MRKHALICAATLAALTCSGTVLASAQDEPVKKAAADADSAQPLSDTWITTKVKSSLLADEDVAGTAIEVDTVNNVVFLTGKVSSQAQVEEAKRLASEVDGVSKVDTSRLVVGTD